MTIIYAVCLGLVCLVGYLDYATGWEISFFVFYAVPIWLASWNAGKVHGLFVSCICLGAWFIADIMTGHAYSHPLIPYWNGLIRLSFFIFTALALADIRTKLTLEAQQADYDGLTNILNSRGFRERAEAIYPLLKRERSRYAVAFIDVDNFKQVNDTFGHAQGDIILKETAMLMSRTLRKSDLLSRLGGDEFVILLPKTEAPEANTVLSSLNEKLVNLAEDNGWPIGFSIGVGVFDSERTDIEAAMHEADTVMYDVKKHGKGQVLVKDFSSPGAAPDLIKRMH